MFDLWKNIVIYEIQTAIFVPPGNGGISFKDRLYHGLVINCSDSAKDYIFSDGRILHVEDNDLFYLPKGSTYTVKGYSNGGCYAINFAADLSDEPFSINVKTGEILKLFKNAAKSWQSMDPHAHLSVCHALYGIIMLGSAEQSKKYFPSSHFEKIKKAEEIINHSFTYNNLSVSSLSEICNISEAYFRRIFTEKYGESPKEYIISLRLNYARQLLLSGEFSVSDIAILCGYQEPCHFSREFSKKMGISPALYKKSFYKEKSYSKI